MVVVTGGASGIGRACRQVLAKKSWKVVVLDIDADGAKTVAGEIGGVSGAQDVGDEIAVAAKLSWHPRRLAMSSKAVT